MDSLLGARDRHRAIVRGEGVELEEGQSGRPFTFGMVTADGVLGFVACPLYELRAILAVRGSGAPVERGRESLSELPDVYMYYAVPEGRADTRPVNAVASRMTATLDPEDGLAPFRGLVAFVRVIDGVFVDLTPDDREELASHHDAAYQATYEDRHMGHD